MSSSQRHEPTVIIATDAQLRALVREEVMSALAGSAANGNDPESFAKPEDIQKLLGISRVTLNRMVKAGLPKHDVAGVRRYRRTEVLAWAAQRGRFSAEGTRKPKVAPENYESTPIPGVTRRSRKAT